MHRVNTDLQRCEEVEDFLMTRIYPMCDGVQRTLVIARPIRPIGQVKTQPPIGVLSGFMLPGTVRMAKNT